MKVLGFGLLTVSCMKGKYRTASVEHFFRKYGAGIDRSWCTFDAKKFVRRLHSRAVGIDERLRHLALRINITTAAIMAPPSTFYDVLKIGRHAQKAEIKEAYRKLALHCHPDKALGNSKATGEFQKVLYHHHHLIYARNFL